MTRTAPSAVLFGAVLLLLAILGPTPGALASNHPRNSDRGEAVHLIAPGTNERVAEAGGRLVARAAGLSDPRVVVSREPFDPTGWTAIPSGAAWSIAPLASDGSVALTGLVPGVHTETALWWAVVGFDGTGRIHASPARAFTLVPRFANRAAAPAGLAPSATGSLAASRAPSFRAIPLAAGPRLRPEGPVRAGELRARPVAAAAGSLGRRGTLVQFGAGSADAARAAIERAGGAVVSAISGEAWLVRMDDAARERLAEGGEAWIADWQPEYKLSTLFDRAATAPVEVTALLFPDGDVDASGAGLTALGATGMRSHRGETNRLLRFTLDPARLADAAALPDIEWMEPAARDSFSNDLAQWVAQTGVPNSRRVWDMGIRGQGQVVNVCDSGLRTTHEMFFDSTLSIGTWGDYPTHRKVIAYKPGSDSPDIAFGDDVYSSYHGTHTSGTVAGNADASSGAPWSGMAKDAKLYFDDMSGPAIGGGLATPDDLNDLFQPSYLGNAGGAARISSNSWGNPSSFGHYLVQSMQVDQFMWNHPDFLAVFAAGNVGVLGSVQAPGTAKDCITVGATGNGALANTLAGFSSGGPTSDSRWKPTLCAPGDVVTSSYGATRYTYAAYSGTSMATPVVAGTLALMREYLVEGWYPTGAPVAANAFVPSAALLKAMAVCATRTDVTPYTSSPNNRSGWGRLTADDALYFAGDSSHTLLVDATDGLQDARYTEYQVRVSDPSRPLRIVLVWTDAPGNPASATQLVNDLDLTVSDGTHTYLGNRILANASATGGLRDSLNVEELVKVATPVAGVYTVRVEGHRVLQGPQPFALCITGGVGSGAGSIALDRFDYALTDTIGIEVLDANAVSPLTVTVNSTTDTWGEHVQLTGGNGVFRGRCVIAPSLPDPGDGVLAVGSGDQVTVSYDDSAPASTVSASARIDAKPPVITEVHATPLSSHSALVTWTTDVAASSRVRYGTVSPATVRDSSGLAMSHAVLITGLTPGQTWRYDVESTTRLGATAADSLGGRHRSFTTRARGDLALVMDDPSASTLATWANALAALGLTADVITKAECDPPLVGDATAGLRSYAAVLWQVDPDRYPPFSDAQRGAIDSLLAGGGRLLVTGHDLGWGMADMGSPTYSEARELWIESALKMRYLYDIAWVFSFTGKAGDPVTGDFTAGVPYHAEIYPDAGDVVTPAPSADGAAVAEWFDDEAPPQCMGLRWESGGPRGAPGSATWGGKTSRLVDFCYEWRALANTGTANEPSRTNVLGRAVDWLVGRRPPTVIVTSPAPGANVTADYLTIRYVTQPDAGRTIVNRALDYSLDGGESWAPITASSPADSGYIWDLGASLGGLPVENAPNVLVRVTATDDGTPLVRGVAATGAFSLARSAGDHRGPVLVGGSAGTSPNPLARGAAGMLLATFSDAETGAGVVSAAEYSLGAAPAAPGAGAAMSGGFGAATVAATATLNTSAFGAGTQYLWLRARDGAGNWGAAAALAVTANDRGVLAVTELPGVDFLAGASPNPSLGPVTLRFGLARAGEARLELFDVAGRRVRTLFAGARAAGQHSVAWDGLDDRGEPARSGVFFARLEVPGRRLTSRLVRLR